MVVIGPDYVRIGRVAVAVCGHRKGRADVQLGVWHRRGSGSATGRIRVQDVWSTGQYDVVRGVPVGRLGHAGVAHFRLGAVCWPDDAGHRGGSSVRHYSVVRRRDS